MAYSKLPLVCQDYPLGFQDVNQAQDNWVALKDLYAVQHGTLETLASSYGGGGRLPWQLAGRHNDVHVARSVLRVSVTVSGSSTLGRSIVTGSAFRFGALTRIGTGQWEVGMQHLRYVYPIGQAEGTATPRQVVCYMVQPTLLYVTTYELSSGGYAPTDYSFAVAAFGSF